METRDILAPPEVDAMTRSRVLPAVLVAACAVAAPAAAEPLALVGEATVSFHFGGASPGLPASMKLLLLLDKGGKGVVASREREPATMVGVDWLGDGQDLAIEAQRLPLGPGSELRWTEWRLRLDEGASTRGKGFLKGHLELTSGGDVVTAGDYEAAVDLVPDRTAPTASLSPVWSLGGEAVLPGEPLLVRFSKPIAAATALSSPALLANNVPVGARAELGTVIQGMTLETRLTPSAPLPVAVALALKLEALTDPAGNVAPAGTGAPLRTITEAGGLSGNPDFESGLTGWITNGGVTAEAGEIHGHKPLEGKKQAVLKTPARLVGVADIPKNGKTLGFYAGAFSEGGPFEPGRSAVIWLVSGSERTPLFDAGTLAPQGPAVEPRRYLVDVEAYRGKRVFIVAETRGSGSYGMNHYTLILDGLTVR
jgi:hypothetical protein